MADSSSIPSSAPLPRPPLDNILPAICAGVFGEGFEPEFFRAAAGQVIIGVVLGEAFGVAVLEMPCRGTPDRHTRSAHQIGTPDEYGDNLVFLEDGLTKPVTRLAPRAEQVLFIKQTVGDLPVGGGGGGADAERGAAGRRMTGKPSDCLS